MKVLYLGALMPHNFHEQNTIFTFLKHGYEVFVLNVSREHFTDEITGVGGVKILNLYESGNPYKGKIGRIRRELNNIGLIKSYKDIKVKIREFIREVSPDIMYCFFGSGVLSEIEMITDMGLNIPIVHNLLCYPAALSFRGVREENRLYKKVINRISLRIYPTENMYNYIKSHINPLTGEDIILKECFSEEYFFKNRLSLLSLLDRAPHLIFLGRTDFSAERPIDDVREYILELVNSGIHVHLRGPATGLPTSKYIHIFPVFDSMQTFMGELSTFMTQFDGCIVMYNFSVKYCMDRFRNTLPSRFLFGLTAGIPILVPEGKLSSCEGLIKEHNIGFTYNSISGLKEILANSGVMSNLRKNAITGYKNFTYEGNFQILDKSLRVLRV